VGVAVAMGGVTHSWQIREEFLPVPLLISLNSTNFWDII